MTGSDDEWFYLDWEAEVTEEETGVADDGGSAVPTPADCASGDAMESAADDDDVSEGRDRGSHCYTDASEDDGAFDEEAYSDDGPFGTTELVYDGAAASADVFVDSYPVGAVAAYATSNVERPDGAADNDASGNNDDCYYGYDGEVYQNYSYGHGSSYGYGDAAYLGGGYYSGYQYLAGYQRSAYQLFYVPGAGMYPQSPVPYVLTYPYAQPASPYGYVYVPYGYPPPAPVIPYADEPSAPPQA